MSEIYDPETHTIVPRHPLPEMLGAFWRTKNTGTTEIGGKFQDDSDVAAYKAMIAAAPSPDRAGDGDLGELERLSKGTTADQYHQYAAACVRYVNKLLPSIQGQGDEGTGACLTAPGHSRAEPFGLGPEAECPSRGPAQPEVLTERMRQLTDAAWDLLVACEEDMETHDPTDQDDEPVGGTLTGPTAVRFGHMRELRRAFLAIPSFAAAIPSGGWQEIGKLAPQTKAMLGRWARGALNEDGSPHWYWQQCSGRYFDYLGERHWCLDGHQFESGPFYSETPTHFLPIELPPPRLNASCDEQPKAEDAPRAAESRSDASAVGRKAETPEAMLCHWGGGNDIIWCSTCGAEYAYAKGEPRPECPRIEAALRALSENGEVR